MYEKQIGMVCYLLSVTAFASSPQSLDGFYAGSEFGVSSSYANQTVQNTVDLQYASLFNSTEPYSNNSSMVRNSAMGALFAGYGRSWKKFYLGGEIALSDAYYNMASSSNTGLSRTVQSMVTITAHETISTQVNLSPVQFGLFLRPGMLLTPNTLLYGRVGTSFATASYFSKVDASKVLTESSTTLIFPLVFQGKKSRNVAALQLGTGIEQSLSDKLTVRLDYLFSYYGKIRYQLPMAGNSIDPFVLSGTGYQSVSINNQSVMLGLAYHFMG